MSEDAKRDRSPNHPKLPLENTIALIEQLYKKAGKTKIKRDVAIGALGYSGPSGASLTTLGALSGYGLLEGERGESISVSPLAIRLIHPTDNDQAIEARREAALKPKVFAELFSSGCHSMDESVLSNHLIQNGFTSDSAKRAAFVFKANVLFAKLDVPGIIIPEHEQEMPKDEDQKRGFGHIGVSLVTQQPRPPATAQRKVLVDYSIPLGSNEAHITISGDRLTSDDFAALRSYVELFQQQFSRSFGVEKIAGTIGTLPQIDGSRIKFLLLLDDGEVVSCMSGAGTKFPLTDFIDGKRISLLGEQKADLLLGRTPFFVFREYEKPKSGEA